jgi:hypothetical protein
MVSSSWSFVMGSLFRGFSIIYLNVRRDI